MTSQKNDKQMNMVLQVLETYVIEIWCNIRKTIPDRHLSISLFSLRRQVRYNVLLKFIRRLPCYVQNATNLQYLIDFVLLTAWEITKDRQYISCIQPKDKQQWNESSGCRSTKMSKKQMQTIVQLVPFEDALHSLHHVIFTDRHRTLNMSDLQGCVFRCLPAPSANLIHRYQSSFHEHTEQ